MATWKRSVRRCALPAPGTFSDGASNIGPAFDDADVGLADRGYRTTGRSSMLNDLDEFLRLHAGGRFSLGVYSATRSALIRSQESNEPLPLIVSRLWSVPQLPPPETPSAGHAATLIQDAPMIAYAAAVARINAERRRMATLDDAFADRNWHSSAQRARIRSLVDFLAARAGPATVSIAQQGNAIDVHFGGDDHVSLYVHKGYADVSRLMVKRLGGMSVLMAAQPEVAPAPGQRHNYGRLSLA